MAISESTCGANAMGKRQSPGFSWSDKACALVYGPVTGIRVWTSTVSTNKRFIQGYEIYYFLPSRYVFYLHAYKIV